ncbi:MAG: caspase family protein, partial [Saprospiraceae bacterium]
MRWILALLLLTAMKSAEKARLGKDYALLFAVSNYDYAAPFGNLKNPVKDARDIAKELKEMYGFETIVYENPTKGKIEEVLEQWQKKTFAPDAQVFVFFSGHGTFRDLNKKGYFVPYLPSGTKAAFESYLDLTDIGNMVSFIPCNHSLLVIDACYSGTLDEEIAFKGIEWSRPGAGGTAERDRLVSNQLRNPSRLLLTSGGKERTPDGINNSPFCSAILKGLRNAYTTGDGLLIYADLLALMERVSPKPHQGELPGHEGGGFVFLSNTTGPAPRPASSPSTVTESPAPTTPSVSPDADLRPYNMVRVRGGTFTMGCTSEQGSDCFDDEKPAHQVTVSDF